MDFLLNGFKVPLAKAGQPLSGLVAKELGLSVEAVTRLTILRESVDARKNKNLAFVYSLKLELTVSQRQFQRLIKAKPNLQKYTPQPARTLVHGDKTLVTRPVVIGAGPAGYFAALTLAKQGYAPILLERGDDVDTRRRLVEGFWQGGSLDTESNVQFGEGGAGTFSD
ncbi:MAG: FAD-binding protein, partial [Peptococcaceae bacterium]|nr:FAD-binding protein [Peptococcaceae bacterium]